VGCIQLNRVLRCAIIVLGIDGFISFSDVCLIFQDCTLMAVNGDAFSMSAFSGHTNWVEFCEHHASIAAEEFSLHVTQFLHDNVAGDRQLSRREFLNKFIDCFQRHFDSAQVLHCMLI